MRQDHHEQDEMEEYYRSALREDPAKASRDDNSRWKSRTRGVLSYEQARALKAKIEAERNKS